LLPIVDKEHAMSLPQTPEAWERLGARIRAERERQGLSRKKLADLAGVSPGSVQSAEGGVIRGRWPQTLSAIERALGWEPDSMRNVLAGGEVEYIPTLFDNSTPAAGGAPSAEWFDIERHRQSRDGGEEEGGHSNETPAAGGAPPVVHEGRATTAYLTAEARARLIAALPEPIRRRLRDVLSFGRACVEYGAPPWVASSYENAVNGLLLAVLNGPGEQSEAVLISYLEDSPIRPWSNAMQPHLLGPAMARQVEKISRSEGQRGDAEGEEGRAGVWRLFSSEPLFDAPKSLSDSVRGAMAQRRIRERIMSVQGQLLAKSMWPKPEVREKLEEELRQLEERLEELENE
jgi:transcriptional regulator with XRE-family HTH domain